MASWTPIENNYYHFLTFDLGDKRIVSKIATLGRSHTNEFVTEYVIQYSDDGELWRSYVSPGGEVQVKIHPYNKTNCFGWTFFSSRAAHTYYIQTTFLFYAFRHSKLAKICFFFKPRFLFKFL